MQAKLIIRPLLSTLLLASTLSAEPTMPTSEGEDFTGVIPAAGIALKGVPFVRNEGQISHPDVRYYARTFAGTIFVTQEASLVYSLPIAESTDNRGNWALRETFGGSDRARPTGLSPSAVRVSHFKGPDPSAWRPRLATFDALDLGELYQGIRVELRATGNSVEKLFRVEPDGDVGDISIAVEGVDEIEVDSRGRLVFATAVGDITFSAPVAYQIVDGQRQPVQVAYRTTSDLRYGFRVGPFDRERELVIDPILASTYLGGHNPAVQGNYDDDIVWGMDTTGGDVWLGGVTQSPDFPIHMGYDESYEGTAPDGFITRLSGDLSTLIASTYLGTDGFDRVSDLAIEESGTIIVVGQAGYGFPVTDGAYNWQGSTPVGGGFVARFSSDLSTLLDSAVVTPVDYPKTLTLGNGAIYFGGSTNYPGFPITADAYKSTCCPAGSFGIREYEGFAGKLSLDFSTLLAMTYLGGVTASSMTVAPDGSVFITDGFDHAVTGSLARFDSGLTARPAYLSYYPGSDSGSSRTYFNDVVATEDYVVAVGQTYMNDLPATEGAFDTTCGTDGLCDGVGPLLVPRSDGFVALYSLDLEDTLALTYLGGSHHESIRSVALSTDKSIYVAGETTSVDFPTFGEGVDSQCGSDGSCDASETYDPRSDGFVARFSSDLSDLGFGSYLGGSDEDWPTVIGFEAQGRARVAGFTASTDFPTSNAAFDDSYNGGTADAFITLIDTGIEDSGAMIFEDGFELGGMTFWTVVVP